MEKRKLDSLSAHLTVIFAVFLINILVAIATRLSTFTSFGVNLLISYIVTFSIALLIFLVFAVPLERGRLKKSSWRYCWLNYFYEGELGKEINICHLPGLILKASTFSFLFVITWFICLILGNIIRPIWDGRYVKLDDEYFPKSEEINWLPKKRVGGSKGIILRPWMPIVLIVVLWIAWKLATKIDFGSVGSATISSVPYIAYGIGSILVISFVVRLLAKWQIWTSIKNLFKAINEKFCIVGKVLDE